MRVAFFLLLLACAAPAQDAAPPQEVKLWGEIEIGEPGVKVTDAAVARKKIAQFKEDYKKTKDPQQRAAALRKLGDWDHAAILNEAAKHLKSKNRFLAIEAAVVLARQSDQKKVGQKLTAALKKEKRHDVICALLVASGATQNTRVQKEAEKWLHYETDEPRNEPRKAAARYLGMIKAKSAFKALATYLDDPQKRNTLDVDDPNNPPPSVWKKRWDAWEAYVPYVRKAMSEIAEGETFETTSEARVWAGTAEAKKMGIEWD